MMSFLVCQHCRGIQIFLYHTLRITQHLVYFDKRSHIDSTHLIKHRKMTESRNETSSIFVKEQEIAKGKWLSLSEITYKDPHGKERKWEAAGRTTTQDGTDGVCVIAVLKRMLKYDCLILVKQYRPPMKCYTLEFPAGLIDPSESAENCAIRELKEETGYTGVAKHYSPATCMDPGFGSATCHLVTAEIDGDIDCNIHPKPNPEESEFIEVLCVPMDELLEKLNYYSKEGIVVNSMVYSYAIAKEQTKHSKNKSSI